MWRRLFAFLSTSGGSATARGAQLLKDNLSPTQLTAYRLSGSFEVVGGDTGRRYRIHRANLLNVAELDEEGRLRKEPPHGASLGARGQIRLTG